MWTDLQSSREPRARGRGHVNGASPRCLPGTRGGAGLPGVQPGSRFQMLLRPPHPHLGSHAAPSLIRCLLENLQWLQRSGRAGEVGSSAQGPPSVRAKLQEPSHQRRVADQAAGWGGRDVTSVPAPPSGCLRVAGSLLWPPDAALGSLPQPRGVRGSAPTLWIFPEKVLVRGCVVRPGPLVCFPHSPLRVPSRGRDVGTGFGGPGSCLHLRGSRGHGIPVSRSVVTTALMSAACSFPPFVPLPRPTCPAAPCLQPLPPGVTTCEKPWLGGLRLPDPQPPR